MCRLLQNIVMFLYNDLKLYNKCCVNYRDTSNVFTDKFKRTDGQKDRQCDYCRLPVYSFSYENNL